MPVLSIQIRLNMKGDTQVENVTAEVHKALAGTGLKAGIVTVFIKHTTASVMIIEDEPGIREDTKAFWSTLIPPHLAWQHNARNPGEDNAHSHLRGQLQGPSITVPFQDGRGGLRYPRAKPRPCRSGHRRVIVVPNQLSPPLYHRIVNGRSSSKIFGGL
jgi:secondary thiamine-phosphate synthase enzyme